MLVRLGTYLSKLGFKSVGSPKPWPDQTSPSLWLQFERLSFVTVLKTPLDTSLISVGLVTNSSPNTAEDGAG